MQDVFKPISMGWIYDRPVALSVAESALAPVVVDAPTATKVYLAHGFSRVQIMHYSDSTAGDTNIYTMYAIDRIGNHAITEMEITGVTYLQIKLATLTFITGAETGEAGLTPTTTDLWSDGCTVTAGTTLAHGNFFGLGGTATVAGPGSGQYNSTANDIGEACVGLPACWAIAFQFTTKDASTTLSNLLLKFS